MNFNLSGAAREPVTFGGTAFLIGCLHNLVGHCASPGFVYGVTDELSKSRALLYLIMLKTRRGKVRFFDARYVGNEDSFHFKKTIKIMHKKSEYEK